MARVNSGFPSTARAASPAPSKPNTVCASLPWRDREFLQLKMAAEVAGVSITGIYRLHDAGKLKLRDLGGRTLVETQSLIALLNAAPEWTPRNRGAEAREKRKEIARAALRP